MSQTNLGFRLQTAGVTALIANPQILATRLSHIWSMELFSISEMLEDAAALAGLSGGEVKLSITACASAAEADYTARSQVGHSLPMSAACAC